MWGIHWEPGDSEQGAVGPAQWLLYPCRSRSGLQLLAVALFLLHSLSRPRPFQPQFSIRHTAHARSSRHFNFVVHVALASPAPSPGPGHTTSPHHIFRHSSSYYPSRRQPSPPPAPPCQQLDSRNTQHPGFCCPLGPWVLGPCPPISMHIRCTTTPLTSAPLPQRPRPEAAQSDRT